MFLGITLQDSKTSSVLNGHIYLFSDIGYQDLSAFT